MSSSVLIVGLGQVGMGYDLHLDPGSYVYTHARAFSQHQDFHLCAAVEPDDERREAYTRIYQTPVYCDLNAALSKHQPDVIVIATETQLHAEVLFEVLDKSDPRAILCEKPLSFDLDVARTMVRACQENEVAFYVNYMRRSDPGVIKVKSLIDSGVVDIPVKGVVWYSKGFIHNGSHFFNLMEYWLGPMKSADLLARGRLWDSVDPEPDVRIKFDKGDVVFLAAWEEAFSHYTVELVSTSGRIRYEQEGSLIQWQPVQNDPILNGYRILANQPETIESGMSRRQLNVVEQLARALDGKTAHLCSGEDALGTIQNLSSFLE